MTDYYQHKIEDKWVIIERINKMNKVFIDSLKASSNFIPVVHILVGNGIRAVASHPEVKNLWILELTARMLFLNKLLIYCAKTSMNLTFFITPI